MNDAVLYVWHVFADIVEMYAVNLLGFLIFRLHVPQVRFWAGAVLLSAASLLMLDVAGLEHTTNNLVLICLTLVCYMTIFHMNFLYAMIIFLAGYVVYVVLQALFLATVLLPVYGSLNGVQHSISATAVGQFGTAALAIGAGCFCYKRRLGFVWLEEKVKIAETVSGFNLAMAVLSVAIIVILQIVGQKFVPGLGSAATVAIAAIMLGVVFIKNRKDIKVYYSKKYPADYLPR